MYQPLEGVFVGRPPCSACHAAYRLHTDGRCPEQYRPGTLDEAAQLLADAEHSGDPLRTFVARGDVQRLSRVETR